MFGEAKQTMLLNAGLSASEQERVERLDSEVFSIMASAGITRRQIWTERVQGGERYVALGRAGFKTDRFAAMSDDEILEKIRVAVDRGLI